MKALSLWPLYATAIAAGAKRIETRKRPIHYRGPLAIHCGVADSLLKRATFERMLAEHDEDAAAFAAIGVHRYEDMPCGRIVAVCRVVDSVHCSVLRKRGLTAREERWGDYGDPKFATWENHWGWILADIHRVDCPAVIRGQQSLWDLPEAVAAQLAA